MITSIDPLRHLENLSYINVHSNPIMDYSPLENFPDATIITMIDDAIDERIDQFLILTHFVV